MDYCNSCAQAREDLRFADKAMAELSSKLESAQEDLRRLLGPHTTVKEALSSEYSTVRLIGEFQKEVERLKAENTDQFRHANAECKRLELQNEALKNALRQYVNVFLPGGICPANEAFCPGGFANTRVESSGPDTCVLPKSGIGKCEKYCSEYMKDSHSHALTCVVQESLKRKCECIPGVHKNCPEHGYPPIRPLEGPGSVNE